MPVYSFNDNSFEKIEKTSFSNEGILERHHLQAALKKNIEVISPDCLIISEEFAEWSGSKRRIDLLGVDKDANLVVFELKRDETGAHMELQAIRYAAMISTLTFKRTVEIFREYFKLNDIDKNAERELLDFLGWTEPNEDDFALEVRIVLVSADFSTELTTSVLWLNERNLDIRCVRLTPYKHNNQTLIDVQQIIPLPEAETYQIKIKQQIEARREARKYTRDLTRYIFKGVEYNKRKLVLAVVSDWLNDSNPENINDLIEAFPLEIHSQNLFMEESEALEIFHRQGIARHFLADDDIIVFSDDTKYVLSNQWGTSNIFKFLDRAKALGYEITEKE